jgi:hypothetical protein
MAKWRRNDFLRHFLAIAIPMVQAPQPGCPVQLGSGRRTLHDCADDSLSQVISSNYAPIAAIIAL